MSNNTPVTIDMQRLRNALPQNGIIVLRHNTKPPKTFLYLECIVRTPTLSDKYPMTYEKDFEQIINWQMEIIGKKNIMEFYTETTGEHWFVYLKRVPIELINVTDEDIKTYSGFTVQQLTKKK